MKVLVTGANGFVGRALVQTLRLKGWPTLAAVRTSHGSMGEIVVGDIDGLTDWQAAMAGIEAVVHLAARVHVTHDADPDRLAEYRAVNTAGTLNLARQAASMGVQRFIFLSTIKVNGPSSRPGIPFRADDPPTPADAYAISKYEAERGLLALADETGMEVVIIRPPLVYGPGVKANFRTLLDWAARPWPLPLGAIRNRRSYVALENLTDLIVTCLDHPAAANQVFLVSDGEDVSTPELLARTRQALGRPMRLWPVPVAILTLATRLVGRRDWTERLCGNLQADIVKTYDVLGWRPVIGLDDGLRRTLGAHR